MRSPNSRMIGCSAVRSALNRRRLLSTITIALGLPRLALAVTTVPARFRLKLTNPHTGETFEGSYRDASGPLPDAMAELSLFLRDFHSAQTIAIDVAAIDFLAAVMDAVGVESADILSAYRTPETNAMLARTTFGVADNSQHLYGRALDVRFGTKLTDALAAARAMKRGGVGWYPRSGFLHIDSGPVRNWDLDETNIDVLLKGSHLRHGADDPRYTATLNHSGQVKPEMETTGRLRAGMEHISRSRP